MSGPFGNCSLCGAEKTLYFYPRPGPAPGNMEVCTRPECGASVEGMSRRLAREIERAGSTATASSDKKPEDR